MTALPSLETYQAGLVQERAAKNVHSSLQCLTSASACDGCWMCPFGPQICCDIEEAGAIS